MLMIAELFTLLSSIDVNKVGKNGGYRVNLNRNRIRSISAFSSNSIFYFNTVVSDQVMPEEMGMVSRMLEKSYASFVVACIGLMPFHRVHADDQAAIESYLSQFHQNLGNGAPNAAISGIVAGAVAGALNTSVQPDDLAVTQDFLMECWEKSRRNCNRFINIVDETVSLNDMYSVDPIDPITRTLQEAYHTTMEELETWGFIGEATTEMVDELAESMMNDWSDADIESFAMGYGDEDDYDDESDEYDWIDDEMDEGVVKDVMKWSAKVGMKTHLAFGRNMTLGRIKPVAKNEEKLHAIWDSIPADVKKKNNLKLPPMHDLYKEITDKGFKRPLKNVSPKDLKEYNNTLKASIKELSKYSNGKIDESVYDLDEGIIASIKGGSDAPKDSSSKITATLATITDNKIRSCQSLVKLRSMEGKLTKLKNKYTSYLNRYKRKWKENKKKGSKAKLRIQFEGMSIGNPKEFMQKFGANIKMINKRLKSVDKRREQLRKQKGITAGGGEDVQLESSLAIELDTVDLEKIDECVALMEQMLDNMPFEYELEDGTISESSGGVRFDYDASRPINDLDVRRSVARLKSGDREIKKDDKQYKTFDKEIFTKMDMEKANEAIPTFAKASIGFIIDETEEVVTRDVLVGIKVQLHVVPAKDLINDMYQCLINKRKFLRFVKWYSGEEKSLADLLFGFKELRTDALNNRAGGAGQWGAAFRQRKRWSKMSIPFLMKEYTPNGTVVFTMNEVQFIRDEYGIDVMNAQHVKMLMEASFLLGFVVLDQANEICYVTYDGHEGQFQQYTYDMLSRERKNDDRAMRELYRAMAR